MTTKRQPTKRPAQRHAARRTVTIPAIRVTVPNGEHLAYYSGITALAVLGLVDPPIAGVLALGHWLVSNRKSKTARELGQAIEDSQ